MSLFFQKHKKKVQKIKENYKETCTLNNNGYKRYSQSNSTIGCECKNKEKDITNYKSFEQFDCYEYSNDGKYDLRLMRNENNEKEGIINFVNKEFKFN